MGRARLNQHEEVVAQVGNRGHGCQTGWQDSARKYCCSGCVRGVRAAGLKPTVLSLKSRKNTSLDTTQLSRKLTVLFWIKLFATFGFIKREKNEPVMIKPSSHTFKKN